VEVQSSGICPGCGERRLVTRKGANHVLHLILTVLTFGLWAVIWFIVAAAAEYGKWRCQVCGTQVKPS